MTPSVILVDGIFHEERMIPACGISAIGAYLRQRGITVELFAPNNRHMNERQAAEFLAEKNPEVIGVSILSYLQYPPFREMVRALGELGWKGFLCVGGHWASLKSQRILEEVEEVNCCVIGDGEETMADLLTRLSSGEDWRDIVGIACSDGYGGIRMNGTRPLKSLDRYPHPATDIVKEMVDTYGTNVPIGILSSRGCYADCSYCSIKLYSKVQGGRPYRMHSIEYVVDEMEQLQRDFGVHCFTFLDDNCLLPGSAGIMRAQELNRLIKQRGLKIQLGITTRPECITYETISLLKDIGLNYVFIGTESFDTETLHVYHRNHTPEQCIHALDVLTSLGFSPEPDSAYRIKSGSMIFHPYVTLEGLYEQAAYVRKYKLSPKWLVKRVIPIPDTPIYLRLEREGLLKEDGTYHFVVPEVGMVYKALTDFYYEFMSIREDIRTVEKKCRFYGLSDDLNHLDQARMAIEEAFIQLFEELCLHGKEGEPTISAIYQHKRACLKENVITPEIMQDLQSILAKTKKLQLSMNH